MKSTSSCQVILVNAQWQTVLFCSLSTEYIQTDK